MISRHLDISNDIQTLEYHR